MNVILDELRFGRPEGMVVISEMPAAHAVMDAARGAPRAVHPAVWTRRSGEKVLHVSPWFADGIEGMENKQGDALLSEVIEHVLRPGLMYFHKWQPDDMVLFLEVRPGDVSEFSNVLRITGATVGEFRILRCTSAAIPNAIAGLLLDIRDRTGRIPHAYFGWTEGNPIAYLLKYLAFGEGDTAPVCREVLRQAEPNPERRPRIHLG